MDINHTHLADIRLPKQYNSLIARLCNIYGLDLTIRYFLNLSVEQFSEKRGIGRLYVERFDKLHRYLTDVVLERFKDDPLIAVPSSPSMGAVNRVGL